MNPESEPDPGEPAAEPKPQPAELSGIDLVRRALEEARAAARANGKSVGQGRASPRRRPARPAARARGWSGAHPDGRDPQLFGNLAGALARNRGWSAKVAEGTVFGRWSAVVGEDVAGHAVPTALRDKVLHVSAESSAWATQLRMLQAQILAKIAAAVGDGVVTSLRITGPAAPSWRKGERHIPGRGPRDTYG
jgi:predicted nucleic acid-binding Zn ribbon protein